MNKTVLVIGIIFLLIGVSVVSSTDNIVKDTHINYQPIESIDISKETVSRGNKAYAYIAYAGGSGHPEGPCYFYLDDPSSITSLAPSESAYFLSGGTWSCDEVWYGCEYNSGGLWKIDPETGDMWQIGGGGISCNGLSWDPVYNRLYGASSTSLFEYDPETGEQEFIGSFGLPNTIVGIAIDSEGVAYIWDVLFSGNSHLWTVDLDTGEATEIGDLGINLLYSGGGHFDYDTDILYIISGNQLFEFDLDTGNFTMIGDFEGGAEITCLAIPYNCSNPPPVTNISFDPPEPDGENGWYVSDVNVTLNATDDIGVNSTYYRINKGVWEIYESPFILSEEGDDVLIEYYSDDIDGYVEDVKSAWLDIDKTPPNVTVEVEVEKIGWRKWCITIIITSNDNSSGMDRVEFFLNEGHQSTVSGAGPTYSWSFVIYGDIPLSVKVIIYDGAGNYVIVVVNSSDISPYTYNKDIFTQQSINPFILRLLERFPLLERFLNTIQGR